MSHIEQLQNKNLKVTPQRLEIVDVLTHFGHINIDNLYKNLQSKFPTISLATIYKNLNTMQDKDFVCEVKIPHQKSVYEITKKKHSHVVCSNCNEIVDIEITTTKLTEEAKSLSGYQLDDSSIVFSGLCPECSK
jgi:Fur family peroxide stress response transcriptional regulator